MQAYRSLSLVSFSALVLTLAGCPGASEVADAPSGADAGGAFDAPGSDTGVGEDGGGTTADGGGASDDGGMTVDDDGGMAASDAGMAASDAGMAASDGGTTSRTCRTNAQCTTPGTYCDKPDGMCGGTGTCAMIPRLCPDIYMPVCGCDGMTYGNACEASGASMNVASTGECATTTCMLRPPAGCCFLDSQCGALAGRCVGETCTAGGAGTCASGRLAPGACWEDSDCPSAGGRPGVCNGERICPCGAMCLLPDAPGTCS